MYHPKIVRIATIMAIGLSLMSMAHAGKPYEPPPTGGGDSSAVGVGVGVGLGVGIGQGGHGGDAASQAKANVNVNTTVQGDTTESNTPPVVAGVLPSVPTSCRLYLFGGGSTRDGAGSGTFPIGNDQTCLSIAKLNLMERAGGFTQKEKQAVVCEVEGMAGLDTCKTAANKKTAAVPAAASTNAANKPWLTDPLARARDGLPPL